MEYLFDYFILTSNNVKCCFIIIYTQLYYPHVLLHIWFLWPNTYKICTYPTFIWSISLYWKSQYTMKHKREKEKEWTIPQKDLLVLQHIYDFSYLPTSLTAFFEYISIAQTCVYINIDKSTHKIISIPIYTHFSIDQWDYLSQRKYELFT